MTHRKGGMVAGDGRYVRNEGVRLERQAVADTQNSLQW